MAHNHHEPFFKALLRGYLQTFKNIFKNSSIFTTMVLSIVLYSFFYPTAYKAETAENLPIIIVDEEQSFLSNTIIAQVAKSPNVKIAEVTGNFEHAKQMIQQQKADGILLLPENLSNSVMRGETGGIGLYLSSAYFLKTKEIGVGLGTAIENTIAEQMQKFGKVSHFHPAIPIHQIPLFNTLSGYGSYIFPAIAPLIIHQTIVLGLCMLIAGYREQKWSVKAPEFFGIYLAALSIGCMGCFYLFGFTFWLNDYPRGGNFWGMLFAVPIFISCVIAMAMVLASYLDISERAGHLIVFTSIPLFLLSGAAWPLQAMPTWMQHFSSILPSTQGINLFIQLNQMGVPSSTIVPKLIYLVCLTFVLMIRAYYRLSNTYKK
ncbi:ABC transporter permease [Acinetobacter sp. WCHAc060033]|uniref:ABC transporter permease n=1 Tax=Acinetobacter sp. WCHAc060033 TaxID=2518624 RepID=UPI0010239661|nr:ABC transporter permease [Acinetobacter sp. WCHAc060033]RZG77925.1 ABC transporter permease [Acinetobacter sp. WCHAc060033]